MVIIRNVFQCKPGQAKNLVALLKQTFVGSPGMPQARVMTDLSAGFWTVVLETEAASLEEWEKQMSASTASGARSPMEGYMELVTGGYREIFRVE
ncbi:MAG: hypothetical protein ACYC7A_03025 [Thermoanaerobaculia bacterium]